MVKTKWQTLYVRLLLVSVLFVVFLIAFLFSLRFYSKMIMKKLENIASLKKEIVQNQTSREKELKFQQLVTLFQNRSGKEITSVLFEAQQILNPDFEKTKEFLLKKFDDEKWKIVNSNFNFEEKKLSFTLEISFQDLNKFLDFLQNQPLVIKVNNLKIEKQGTSYQVEISWKLK